MKSLFKKIIILAITVVLFVAGGCKSKPAPEKPVKVSVTFFVDETGQDVEKGKGGILVIKRPWPIAGVLVNGSPMRRFQSFRDLPS